MLPAHVAIANLIYTYAEKIDLGDFDGVAELFTHAVVTAEGTGVRNVGKEQTLKMYVDTTRRYPDNGTPHTKHVTTNLIFDIDEDAGEASCRSYFTVLQQTDSLALQPVIAGRYHDRFERVDGHWRFTTRHMFSDLIGDLSQHLLIDIGVL